MTTAPVHSITDEQIADIEQRASMGLSHYVHGVSSYAVISLIARLRAAERDAARYRWLRESMWYVGPDNFFCGEGGDMNDYENHNYRADTLDTAIDTAMQEHTK